MFSDEKIFTVNGGMNKQNDRVYAVSRDQANENGGKNCFRTLINKLKNFF